LIRNPLFLISLNPACRSYFAESIRECVRHRQAITLRAGEIGSGGSCILLVLRQYGCGLTTVVPRATAQAAELSRSEIELAGDAFRRKIEQYAPRHIVFLGKMALSAISGTRNIDWGPQTEPFGGAHAWVVPNPSGLNRAFSLDALVAAYREVRIAVASTP
jgi:uracil-DNA glycosylase